MEVCCETTVARRSRFTHCELGILFRDHPSDRIAKMGPYKYQVAVQDVGTRRLDQTHRYFQVETGPAKLMLTISTQFDPNYPIFQLVEFPLFDGWCQFDHQ